MLNGFTLEELQDKKKVLLIYNPYSGNGMFPNYLDLIIEKFQEKAYVIRPIRGTDPVILDYIFSHMHPEHYRQVIVAGGDGTVNIVVNAMLNHGIDLPLAIFPSGTANDFAYYLDLPEDIEDMIEVALGNNTMATDVAKVNDKYYINVAAMGTLVDVSQKTDPNLKNTIGIASYYLRGLSDVKDLHPIPIKIESEEYCGEEEMYFMVVMNGCSAGGFKRLSTNADAGDGLLDVMIFKKMPIHEIPPLFFSVLTGTHLSNKNVIHFQTNHLHLESPEDVSTDVDGEKGEKFPLDFTVLHKKLHIFTPLK